MIDLSTQYLGLALKNPLVCSPSPLCQNVGNIRQMEDAGAGAVVLHSLFEEQIEMESEYLDWHLEQGAESFAEAPTYFPDLPHYKLGPEAYLEHLAAAKDAVDIPVIASLNGITSGGWINYATRMEEAGADALELNVFFVATDPETDGAGVENRYCHLVQEIKSQVSIPVAVKIAPYFSSMAHFARQLDAAGVDGLVLFNRFYQPDLDVENLEVTPNLVLSTSAELRLRLLWVAVLYDHIRPDMAITGGVHAAEDVIKSMMAGASVAMMTSALLRHGIEHLSTVRHELMLWMEDHEYESIVQMRGSMSQRSVRDPEAYERANYLKLLSSYSPATTRT